MEKAKVSFETDPAIKAALEAWAREEDRSAGSLLRRIVEKAIQGRRAVAEMKDG